MDWKEFFIDVIKFHVIFVEKSPEMGIFSFV